ncbi:MAG: hypothetical protein GF381_01275 [Candidatus Pacebacteria bacterium]|nr:hypothetical protein [Candidatus Paceibacterota bacterium]
MGAVPKNKITSVERGKRRAGNRPDLVKDINRAKAPLHKRGLVAQMFRRMGLSLTTKTVQSKTGQKKSKKSSQ